MMTTASAKNRTVRAAACLLALVLILMSLMLATGCSKDETTTTTTAAVDTSTTEVVTTSTTGTTEAVTTTTEGFPPTLSHEETDTRLIFSGSWQSVAATSALGKHLMVANKAGCTMTARFYGTAASWVAKKSPAYGQATVTVDGGSPKTVDLYSATTVWKKKVWTSGALKLGDHTVTIAWTGKKAAKATATNINVDQIIVTGVMIATYQQDATKIKYAGTWKKTTSGAASGGSFTAADKAGASVTVQFSGVRAVWVSRTGPGYGQAKVTVDGKDVKTVDLYASAIKAKQEVFDTGVLDMGTHTVKITWAGTKNAAATGTAIVVDAFEVTGSLK
jgi:hypothetical protein